MEFTLTPLGSGPSLTPGARVIRELKGELPVRVAADHVDVILPPALPADDAERCLHSILRDIDPHWGEYFACRPR